RPLFFQCDREPARLDRGAASFDLRRCIARPSEPQTHRRARGRFSAGILGSHRPCSIGAAGLLRATPPDADDISEARLFRCSRLHPPPARLSRRAIWRRPHILMGTDYPADMGEVDPIGMIEGAPGLDDVERRAILGGNAARLLNLEVPATPL